MNTVAVEKDVIAVPAGMHVFERIGLSATDIQVVDSDHTALSLPVT